MKKRCLAFLLTLCLLCSCFLTLFCCGNISETPPPEKPDPAETEDTSEKPDNGTVEDPEEPETVFSVSATAFSASAGVGWNLGNTLDCYLSKEPDARGENLDLETAWHNPKTTRGILKYVSDSGFDVIRIPVSWYYHTYEDEAGHLRIYENWIERVRRVVQDALDLGFFVILNSHHDMPMFFAGVSDEEFACVLRDVTDIWGQIAEAFSDFDGHLIFEAFNEIDNLEHSWRFGERAARQMNEMNQTFVDTVRATGGNNGDRLLMVPTLIDGTSEETLAAFVLPTDTAHDRLLIQVHSYSQLYAQDIEPLFTSLEQFSERQGAPVVIGEFGTKAKDFAPAAYRTVHAANYVARAAAHGILCIWWDNGYSDEYGIIARKSLTDSDTSLIQALTEPQAFASDLLTVYTSIDSFVYQKLNNETGALESPTWGVIVLSDGKNMVSVPNGATTLTLSVTVAGDAQQCKIHQIYFFDENGTVIADAKTNDNYGFFTKGITVPSGARYVRVSIYNSYESVSLAAFTAFLADGDLKLTLCWAT